MPRYVLRHLVSCAILGRQEMVPGAFQSGLRQAKGKASTFFGLDATSMANTASMKALTSQMVIRREGAGRAEQQLPTGWCVGRLVGCRALRAPEGRPTAM